MSKICEREGCSNNNLDKTFCCSICNIKHLEEEIIMKKVIMKHWMDTNKKLKLFVKYAQFFMLNDYDRFDNEHVDAKKMIMEYKVK